MGNISGGDDARKHGQPKFKTSTAVSERQRDLALAYKRSMAENEARAAERATQRQSNLSALAERSHAKDGRKTAEDAQMLNDWLADDGRRLLSKANEDKDSGQSTIKPYKAMIIACFVIGLMMQM